MGVGVTIFWRNPQKAQPWLIPRVWAIVRANPLIVFPLGERMKKGHY